MPTKRIAHSIALYHDDDADTTYDKIANMRKLTRPGLERASVNITGLEDDVELFDPSPVLNVGELGFELYWDEADTDHQAVEAFINDDDPVAFNWQIWFVFGATTIKKQFSGWLMRLGEAEHENGKEITRQGVIKLTSKMTTVA